MAYGTAKVAISMPKDLFQAMERIRRELRIPRSAAVVEALRAWLKSRQEKEQIRQYVEGYRRHPESKAEVKAWTRLAAESFHKDPW